VVSVGAARHFRARGLAGPAGAFSHAPPVLRLVPAVLRGGERNVLAAVPRWPWRGIGISALLHAGVVAAALWWMPTSSGHEAPSVAMEMVFWPAAQQAEAPSGDLAAQSAEPVQPQTLPEVTPEQVPLQTAEAMPPEPVREPRREAPTPVETVTAIETAHAETPPEPLPPEHTAVDQVPSEPLLEAIEAEPVPAPEQVAKPVEVAPALPRPPPPRPRPAPVAQAKPVEPKPAAAPAPQPPQTEPVGATSSVAAPVQTSEAPVAVAAAPAASARSADPPVVHDPRYRHPPTPPRFPPRALELNQQGTVIVRALVGPDGNSGDVVVWRSSGYALLDAAALRAVRGWAFEPASVGGRRIAAWVEVPVRFAIR
jgi:protein TonB